MNKILRLFIIVGLVLPLAVEARPKIGLVLSGGGARGAAHIGVLRYLEEQKIPIDVIAGTSMGAIVGGLYASGLSVDEIEKITIEMDWIGKLKDNVPRPERSIQRKRMEDIFSVPVSIGVKDGEIRLPSGAIQGQNIVLELQRITHHVSSLTDFGKLPIPFSAVATNIGTGKAVILNHGSLGVAMRASMGVPAIFAAIRVDGMLLVDGGVTNNLPIDIAREMGADRLIVVDISSPLRNPSEINNILDVADQLTTMLTTGNTNRQLETLAEQDVLIRPELGDLSSVDFERTDEAIAIGYKAALQADSVLNGFKVDDDQYIVREKPHPPSEKITSIMLDNNSGLNDKLIRNTLDMEHGEELDLDLLEEKLNRVHGLGNFELVGYDLAFEEQGVDLKLMATAKSWGPNYLHMGLDIESDLDNDSRATLLLGYTREEVSDKGAEWTVVVGIGEEPIVQSIWYQPLTYHRDWFFLAAAGYGSEIVSQFEDDEKIAEFGLEVLSAYVGIGYEFGSFAATSVGLRRASGTANLKIGDPAIPDFDFEDGSVVLAFLYDTRDKISFPSQGSLLELEVSASLDVLGADENYQQWILGLGKAFSWGNHNLGLRFSAGGTNGVNNVNSLFRLGGYGKLTGLRRDQLTGNYMAVASAVYYRRFGAIPVLDGYIGSIVEYGGAWQDRDDISADTSIFSAGVFIGADTPIGAIQIGIAHADQGETTAFARIGRVF